MAHCLSSLPSLPLLPHSRGPDSGSASSNKDKISHLLSNDPSSPIFQMSQTPTISEPTSHTASSSASSEARVRSGKPRGAGGCGGCGGLKRLSVAGYGSPHRRADYLIKQLALAGSHLSSAREGPVYVLIGICLQPLPISCFAPKTVMLYRCVKGLWFGGGGGGGEVRHGCHLMGQPRVPSK